MKKKYSFPEENPEKNIVNEPVIEYGKQSEIYYDIPKDYLLKRIAQAEIDIAEGRVTPLSEMKKKPLP